MTNEKNFRDGVVWNLIGSFLFAFSTWAISFIISKHSGAGNYDDAGVFALALSYGNIFFIFAIYVIRAYFISDISGKYTYGNYTGLRLLTVIAAWILCFLISLIPGYSPKQITAISIYMFFFCAAALSDVFYGIMQRGKRIDSVGKSQTIRGAASVAIFAVMLFITDNLLLSLTAVSAVSLSVVLFYDIPKIKALPGGDYSVNVFCPKTFSLMKESGPMLIYQLAYTMITFLPRILLEHLMGNDAVAIFTYVFAPTVVITTFSINVFLPYLSKMTYDLESNNIAHLKKLFLSLLAVVSAAGICAMLVSMMLGSFLLTIVYDSQIGRYTNLLVISMAASTGLSLLSCCNYLIIAIRKIKELVIINVTGCILVVLFCFCLIPLPSVGIYGAAWAIILGAIAELAAILIIIFQNLGRASVSAQQSCD